MMTRFDYLYRDAGNFKAYGSLAFEGELAADQLSSIRERLSGDGLFVAEQLDIPPLYERLYRWSDGPIASDHCWHEFVDVRPALDSELSDDAYRWGSAKDFFVRLSTIDVWNEELSPHFRLVT